MAALNTDSKLDLIASQPLIDPNEIPEHDIDKTLYSVTDGVTSQDDPAMGTDAFRATKLSRSQLEQRSILVLKNEIPLGSSIATIPHETENNGNVD